MTLLGNLDQLVIEQTSPRDTDNNKILQTYDQSLSFLRQRGFARHLRPDEAFKMIIEAITNPDSQYKSIKDDMSFSCGEWLSLAMLRQKGTLMCYLDPENIIRNKCNYIIQGQLKHSGERRFNIGDIESDDWIDLKDFPDDLVKFLYSLSFSQLPSIMQSGDQKAQIWLPPEGIIMPCGRGDLIDGMIGFDIDGYFHHWASRGMRILKS